MIAFGMQALEPRHKQYDVGHFAIARVTDSNSASAVCSIIDEGSRSDH